MSMGALGTAIKRTKLSMVSQKAELVSKRFQQLFNLKDGDYLNYERNTSQGKLMTLCRIISVEECYRNQRGGHTAWLKVMPMLESGNLGNTKGLYICMDASGLSLSGIGNEIVTRASDPEVHEYY